MIIYISGIDGCGKTTQATQLVEGLNKAGFQAEYLWLRWEPSIIKVINWIRSIKRKNKDILSFKKTDYEMHEYDSWTNFKKNILANKLFRTLWITYASFDYSRQAKKIVLNKRSPIVVVDRYLDDFLIDLSINLGFDPENLERIGGSFFLLDLPRPDFKAIIEIPAIEGYNRKQDGTPLNYLEQRCAYYKSIAEYSNSKKFNGLNSVDSLRDEIFEYVIKVLKKNDYE